MGLECGSIKGLEDWGGRIDGYIERGFSGGEKGLRCGEGRVAADF